MKVWAPGEFVFAADLNGNFSQTFGVRSFGAVGDGVADDTAAVLACVAAATVPALGGRVYFPAGRYNVSQTIISTLGGLKSLIIEGDGEAASEIVWTADVDGWTVDITDSAYSQRSGIYPSPTVQRRNIGFVRSQPATGKTAFLVQGVGAIGSAGMIQVVTEGVIDRADSTGGGWAIGCHYSRCAQTTTKRLYHHAGTDAGATTSVAIAIDTTSDYISVDHHIHDVRMAGGATLLTVGDYVQGVNLSHFSAVGPGVVNWQGVSGHGCDMLTISNGHCGVRAGNTGALIRTANVQAVSVQGCYLLGSDVGACIDLVNTTGTTITGNLLYGAGHLGDIGVRVTNDGTVLATDVSASITGNAFKYFDMACVLAGATSNARFTGNLIGLTNVTCSDTTGNLHNECDWNNHYSGLQSGPDQSGQSSYYFADGHTNIGSKGGSLHLTSSAALLAGGNVPAGQTLSVDGTVTVNGVLQSSATTVLASTLSGAASLYMDTANVAVRVPPGGGFLVQASGTTHPLAALFASQLNASAGIGVWGHAPPTSKPNVTGSYGSSLGTIVSSLLAVMVSAGFCTDSTVP